MPVYSIKEFAHLTGRKPKDIHTYATRGKIIKNNSRQIDTTNAINFEFLESNRVNGEVKKVNDNPKPKKNTSEKLPKEIPINSHTLVIHEKARLELELKRKELELKEIDISKRRGESIDLQDAISTVKNYSESMKRELHQNIKVFVQDICSRHSIDSGKAGEYKMKVIDLINKSNKTSIQNVLKQFKNE